jgi:hypothetical protein
VDLAVLGELPPGCCLRRDKEPGYQFCEMARSLGYRFGEPRVFLVQQFQDVFKLYGRLLRSATARRAQPHTDGPVGNEQQPPSQR